MSRRLLVTGGSGFLGLPLCRKLQESGGEVLCVDRQSGMDITNWSRLSSLEGYDVVYHLAALAGVDVALERPRETYSTNILGTLNVLEYCRIREVKRLVFASSYVYGPPMYLPVDENHPVNPGSPYAQSKAIGEALCRQYHDNFGIPVVILRIFNPYGPKQRGNFLIPTILSQMQQQGRVILRDPAPKRDFVFVEDVANAFAMAGLYAGSEFGVFNVGSGISYSVAEVVGKIQKILGRAFGVTYTGPCRPFEVADCVAGIERAKVELGWEPKTDLDSGLGQTIRAWGW